MITKNFEQWLAEEVEESFGIEQVRFEEHKIAQTWLHHENLNLDLHPNIKRLQNLLQDYVNTWNEDELKLIFIGPLLIETDLHEYPHYKIFTQRKAIIKTETVEAQGRIEWIIAKGKQTPKHPFFFLLFIFTLWGNEKGANPLGQLLIAMVYAQNENQDNIPIYGSYVLGRFWFFVVLENQQYSVSRAYDATQTDDLAAMMENFKKVRQHIRQVLGLTENAT